MRSWLRQIRTDKGATQEMVARAAGISRCYYTQIELSAQKGLHPDTAMRIAGYLEFDWTIFYKGSIARHRRAGGFKNQDAVELQEQKISI